MAAEQEQNDIALMAQRFASMSVEEINAETTRDERKQYQQYLTDNGFDTQGIDGILGPKSQAAMAAFAEAVAQGQGNGHAVPFTRDEPAVAAEAAVTPIPEGAFRDDPGEAQSTGWRGVEEQVGQRNRDRSEAVAENPALLPLAVAGGIIDGVVGLPAAVASEAVDAARGAVREGGWLNDIGDWLRENSSAPDVRDRGSNGIDR